MSGIKHILLSYALIAIGLAVSACGTAPMRFSTSNTVPAAEGNLKADDAENNNTALDIEVKHLAPPQKVTSNAMTYVVWLRPTGGAAADRQPGSDTSAVQNIGALQVDKELTGRLKTVTPHKSFDVFITAEPSATAPTPSGDRLLWAQVNR